ncbi:MAG TPA: response regulator transcription factor [Bacteroidales bacterium]|nr:response regulator transcription factor [Bacteroidales bacterium]
MKRTKIFYIEDEQSLGRIVCDTLGSQGYEVKWESDGASVIRAFENYFPDICVLDIMLPHIDGYSLCRTIRGLYPALPVIFLTAKTTVEDLVEGFEAGGTDYVRKPFRIEELIVRIENQLRLGNGIKKDEIQVTTINIGRIIVDLLRHEINTGNGTIRLSNRDMQVLKILNANRNRVTSRRDLLMAVWGDDSYFNSRNLDVYIRKLRGYLSADSSVAIITLKGDGYLFLVP